MASKTKMWYVTLYLGTVYVAERDELLPHPHKIKIRAIQASAAARQFKRHNIPHDYVRMLEQDLQSWFDDKKYHKEFMKEKVKALALPVVEVKEGQELSYFAEQARRRRTQPWEPVPKHVFQPERSGSVFANKRRQHA